MKTKKLSQLTVRINIRISTKNKDLLDKEAGEMYGARSHLMEKILTEYFLKQK